MTRPKLTELRVATAALETTAGVFVGATNLASAQSAFNVYNPSIEVDVEQNERQGQGSMSPLSSVPGKTPCKVKFMLEMTGNSGTATAAWAGTFLPALGLYPGSGSNANTFTVSSTNYAALSFGLYEDGIMQQASGLTGTYKINAETGKTLLLDCEMTGVYLGPTNVAMVTPASVVGSPLVFEGSPVTLGGFAPALNRMEISANNTVTLRPAPGTNGQTNVYGQPTGLIASIITGRKISATLDPEETDLSTRDWQSKLMNATQEAFVMTVNSGTHGITITGPAVQTIKRNRGDRSGLAVNNVDLQFNRSAAAGDDEFSLQIY